MEESVGRTVCEMETVSEGEIVMKSVAARRRRGDEQRGRGEGREWDVEGSGRKKGGPLFRATTRPLWALWSSPLFASASLYRHFILLRLIAAIKHYTDSLQKERERERGNRRVWWLYSIVCPEYIQQLHVHIACTALWISTIYTNYVYTFFDGLVPYGGSMIRLARSRELSAVNQTVYVNVSRSFVAKLLSW